MSLVVIVIGTAANIGMKALNDMGLGKMKSAIDGILWYVQRFAQAPAPVSLLHFVFVVVLLFLSVLLCFLFFYFFFGGSLCVGLCAPIN